jgi:hypothetical protein
MNSLIVPPYADNCASLSIEMMVAHDAFSAIRGRLYEYASSYHNGTVFVCSYY